MEHILTREQILPGNPDDVFGFEPHARGTLMRDTVRYALPLGPIGRLAQAAFVRRDLERIFGFRQAEVARRHAYSS